MGSEEGSETTSFSHPSARPSAHPSAHPSARPSGAVAGLVIHACAIGLALATLVLVGQPIYANDTWVHLAMGQAFAAAGPWLEVDPHLFAAPGPPAPSSWIGSLALYQAWAYFGFTGLRVLHVCGVAGILGLAWIVVRRSSGSRWMASAGLVLFILLSTYRLVQLRPALFSMAALLAVYLLLVSPREGPRPAAIWGAVALMVVWANTHAAFLLGPLLILGASACLFLYSFLGAGDRSTREPLRAGRLARAGGLMLFAGVATPQGWHAHLAYFAAGGETSALGVVADEWNATNLLALPLPNLPPTWAAWLVCWLCTVTVAVAVLSLLRSRPDQEGGRDLADRAMGGGICAGGAPSDDGTPSQALDPALVSIALAGVAAAILASRFLWLAVFALAVAGGMLSRGSRSARAEHRLAATIAALVLAAVGTHFVAGDWPLVSRVITAPGSDYSRPYDAAKFHGHAMWFLADSEVEGRIYNPYQLGGFMSFWLSPRLQMASSGTMNVEREAMEANLAIAARTSLGAGESFAALLDRQGFDLFLGVGLPIGTAPGQPIATSVRHLEHEEGWMPVFRGLRNVIYLRRAPRNDENLERIRAYYARAGVPFDRERGFDVERAIVEAPQWSVDHGLIPADFEFLLDEVRALRARDQVGPASHRLAVLYSVLGLYERALTVERFNRRLSPGDLLVARRLLWDLVQLGRVDEAFDTALKIERGRLGNFLGDDWSSAIEEIRGASEGDRRSRIALMALFDPVKARFARIGLVAPRARHE
ncbi:MAG: hypothetical protein CL933_15045 [Deltaproteobacteria bacterium]|nr:hypothetical protein [Deltaproteobacteria bacterium]